MFPVFKGFYIGLILFFLLAVLAIYCTVLTLDLEKIIKTKYPDLYNWAIQPSGKWYDNRFFGEKIANNRWMQLLYFPPEDLYKIKDYQMLITDPLYRKVNFFVTTYIFGVIGWFFLMVSLS